MEHKEHHILIKNYPYLYFGHGGNHPHEFQIISYGHRKAGSPVYYGDHVYIYNKRSRSLKVVFLIKGFFQKILSKEIL